MTLTVRQVLEMQDIANIIGYLRGENLFKSYRGCCLMRKLQRSPFVNSSSTVMVYVYTTASEGKINSLALPW